MKIRCRHTSDEFLQVQMPPVGIDEVPTVKIGFQFLLNRNSQVTRRAEYYALADTGADMTALPLWLIGDWINLPPTDHYESPRTVLLRGLHSSRRVAAYRARVSIGGKDLPELLPIAAVSGLRFPIVGRDILNHFYMCVDAFSDPKKTILVDQHQRAWPRRLVVACTGSRDMSP